MIKKILTLLLTSVPALGIFAEDSVLDFTYAEGELRAYGNAKVENIDVAICIDDPSYAGMKLTGFRAYLNTAENISNTSLWMSSELKLVDKVNVPDIDSFDVTPVLEGGLNVISINLEKPYLLTGDPLYLGYSVSVDAVETYEDKFPLILSEGVNEKGLYLHTSRTILKWMSYSNQVGGVAFLVAEFEGNYDQYSLGFKNYETIYAEEEAPFSVNFTVLNSGVNEIEKITYTYSVDDGEVKEAKKDLDFPISSSLSSTSDLILDFDGISGYGSHDLSVTITEVNGETNESSDATIDCVVNVIPFIAQHRPLIEEVTGLWCQYCPRGMIGMEMIAEEYGDNQVTICYHNDDDMEVTTTYPFSLSGLPGAAINRGAQIDPYYGSTANEQFGISKDVDAALESFTIASIDVEGTIIDKKINVTSSIKFIQDIEDANYQVGYVLVCNGLTHEDWVQKNAFSKEPGFEGTPLEVLTTWPERVSGLVFNDVAVDVSGMFGVEGSLPSSIVTNEEYVDTYNFNIEGNELVQNTENLIVAAFIIDKNTKRIVNSNKCGLQVGGIKGVDIEATTLSVDYYDLTGQKVSHPSNGIFILREKLSNGEIRTSKRIIR